MMGVNDDHDVGLSCATNRMLRKNREGANDSESVVSSTLSVHEGPMQGGG